MDLLWNVVGISGLLSILLVVWDVMRGGQFRSKPKPTTTGRARRDGPGRLGNVRVVPIRRHWGHSSPIRFHDSGDVGSWHIRDRQEQEAWG